MLLASGTVVGDYTITGVLGKGAFGTVYAAVHPVIGKHAAIKVLEERAAESEELVQRFRHEARAVNAIEHPNIVDIFGYGTLPDERPYLIMELLRGGTLSDIIKQHGGRLLPEVLFPILRDVASAVDAAHRAGVIHRDLKPENIFLAEYPDAPPRVKVLDFGIAKVASQSMVATQEGRQMGTPLYMAPEQCFGHAIDHHIDVYAFGVIAFHGLTGAYPVIGDSMIAIVGMHLLGKNTLPSQLDRALERFDGFMIQCLHREPGNRFASLGAAFRAMVAAHGEPLPGDLGSLNLPGLSSIRSGSRSPALPYPAHAISAEMDAAQTIGTSAPGLHSGSTGHASTGGSTLGRATGVLASSPSHRSRAGVIGAVGLLIAALAAVAIVVTVQASGSTSSDASVSPERAQALAAIKRSLLGETWEEAMAGARAVLDIDPDDSQARALLDQAREERKNQQLHGLFMEAVSEKPPDAMNVATLYEAIPESSVYRHKATPDYTQVRAAWLAPRASRAGTLASARQCTDLALLADEVALVFPESSARFEAMARKCAGGDDEADDATGKQEAKSDSKVAGDLIAAEKEADEPAAAAPSAPSESVSPGAVASAPAPTSEEAPSPPPPPPPKGAPAPDKKKRKPPALPPSPVTSADRAKSDEVSGSELLAGSSTGSADGLAERLGRNDITRVMQSVRVKALSCASQGEADRGLVSVKVTVAPAGSITSVTVTSAPSSALGQCVARLVEETRFPATRLGGTFSYPFAF